MRGWESEDPKPELTVDVDAGEEGQPVFVFSLLLDLDEDFDPAEFPSEAVEQLKADLRARVVDSEVDHWDWLVTAAARPRTGHE